MTEKENRLVSDVISKDLKTVLKGLRLSRMLDTLPERFVLALTAVLTAFAADARTTLLATTLTFRADPAESTAAHRAREQIGRAHV